MTKFVCAVAPKDAVDKNSRADRSIEFCTKLGDFSLT